MPYVKASMLTVLQPLRCEKDPHHELFDSIAENLTPGSSMLGIVDPSVSFGQNSPGT